MHSKVNLVNYYDHMMSGRNQQLQHVGNHSNHHTMMPLLSIPVYINTTTFVCIPFLRSNKGRWQCPDMGEIPKLSAYLYYRHRSFLFLPGMAHTPLLVPKIYIFKKELSSLSAILLPVVNTLAVLVGSFWTLWPFVTLSRLTKKKVFSAGWGIDPRSLGALVWK